MHSSTPCVSGDHLRPHLSIPGLAPGKEMQSDAAWEKKIKKS
jgi:hypothetical protein